MNTSEQPDANQDRTIKPGGRSSFFIGAGAIYLFLFVVTACVVQFAFWIIFLGYPKIEMTILLTALGTAGFGTLFYQILKKQEAKQAGGKQRLREKSFRPFRPEFPSAYERDKKDTIKAEHGPDAMTEAEIDAALESIKKGNKRRKKK